MFLYSRKPQIIMLLCWLAAMGFIYAQADNDYFDLSEEMEDLSEKQEVSLGKSPEIHVPPPLPPAPVSPQPPADPTVNHCLDLRLVNADTEENAIVLELDYIAAQTNGFAPEKARSYYIDDSPTFVIALGEPWVSETGNASFTRPLPQVPSLNLIVSRSKNLRLLVHTSTVQLARKARFNAFRTDRGVRIEIYLPAGTA
ncbi:MAG: hypothetical protein IJD04_08125 [Desulfovibrionaceae bacterium]|nr:hypothetical protein [Desulfovibrionaceae bacterium]